MNPGVTSIPALTSNQHLTLQFASGTKSTLTISQSINQSAIERYTDRDSDMWRTQRNNEESLGISVLARCWGCGNTLQNPKTGYRSLQFQEIGEVYPTKENYVCVKAFNKKNGSHC